MKKTAFSDMALGS